MLAAEHSQRPPMPSPIDRAVRVSRTFAKKLGHLLRVDGDDLASTALIELARARSSYDAAHGLSLETFLTLRARWAMLTRAKRMRRRFAPRRGMPMGVARRYVDGRARRLCLRPEKDHRAVRSMFEFRTSDCGAVIPAADLSDTVVQNEPGPEVLSMRRQTRNTLDRAIATLPPEERIVLRLHYFSSLKFVQIASMLNLTRQRVCKLHRSGLARCRRHLLRTGCDRASLGT